MLHEDIRNVKDQIKELKKKLAMLSPWEKYKPFVAAAGVVLFLFVMAMWRCS